jgi:hypothetical protein
MRNTTNLDSRIQLRVLTLSFSSSVSIKSYMDPYTHKQGLRYTNTEIAHWLNVTRIPFRCDFSLLLHLSFHLRTFKLVITPTSNSAAFMH